jgi:hypothetical protein
MVKLKATAIPAPESIDLPGYFRDRDAQAARAGLRLERLMNPYRYIDCIITHYHGSKEQILASGFVADDFRWPCTNHPIMRGVRMFSPSLYQSDYGGRVHLNVDGTFRLTLKEDCPRDLVRLGPELERYELHDVDVKPRRTVVSRIVHHGSKRALLAAGVARNDALDDDRARERGVAYGTLWETTRTPNGWWIHTRDLGVERHAEEQKQKERRAYQSPDAFREHVEDLIVGATRLFTKNVGVVETHHGYRYTLDPAALQEVINAIEVAAQGLRNVPVKVEKLVTEEAQATARESSARASNDANFQRFIDRLLHNGERPQE